MSRGRATNSLGQLTWDQHQNMAEVVASRDIKIFFG